MNGRAALRAIAIGVLVAAVLYFPGVLTLRPAAMVGALVTIVLLV